MNAITKAAPLAALFASLMLGQGFRPLDITPPDPAIMIANQVARLTTLLDLTTAQASQITTILTNTQSAIGALQTTLSTDQTAFNHRLRLDRHRRVTGPDPRCASKAAAAIYILLTSTQQAKVTTLGIGILTGGGGPGSRGPGECPERLRREPKERHSRRSSKPAA